MNHLDEHAAVMGCPCHSCDIIRKADKALSIADEIQINIDPKHVTDTFKALRLKFINAYGSYKESKKERHTWDRE